MAAGVEAEDLVAVDGPAREDERGVLDVLLGVAAVDTDGVQLQQLATVVLLHGRFVALVAGVLVVEVVQHRRIPGAGDQQVGEPAERVRTVDLPVRDGAAAEALLAGAVVDRLGRELLVEPRVDATVLDPGDHLVGRTERRTSQQVQHLIVGEHRFDGRPGRGRTGCRRRARALRSTWGLRRGGVLRCRRRRAIARSRIQ